MRCAYSGVFVYDGFMIGLPQLVRGFAAGSMGVAAVPATPVFGARSGDVFGTLASAGAGAMEEELDIAGSA